MYWRGDRITWRNLLRHYVICLGNRMFEALLTPDDETLDPTTVSVFRNLDNLPTPQARELFQACITEVERGELHGALLDLLANAERDISFAELNQHLRTVHLDWLISLHEVFFRQGLVARGRSTPPPSSDLTTILRTFQAVMPDVREQVQDIGIEIIHDVQQSMAEQMTLLAAYQNADLMQPKRESLFFEFPGQYLRNLIRLVYPPWYVACFSARHDNAAMWSYYAGNHTGCCLVFKTGRTEDRSTLKLTGPNGYGSGGVSRHSQNRRLDEVRYSSDEQRIEFFSNIGRMTQRELMQNWFQDEAGETSPLAAHLETECQEAWRNAYWDNFAPPLLQKLPDWQHEQEYRIILSDILGLHDDHEGRTFTYDYNTLDGIIFGINVSLSNKVRIMRIVDQKLSSRTVSRKFKFYQARYNRRTGAIDAEPMNLFEHASRSATSAATDNLP